MKKLLSISTLLIVVACSSTVAEPDPQQVRIEYQFYGDARSIYFVDAEGSVIAKDDIELPYKLSIMFLEGDQCGIGAWPEPGYTVEVFILQDFETVLQGETIGDEAQMWHWTVE